MSDMSIRPAVQQAIQSINSHSGLGPASNPGNQQSLVTPGKDFPAATSANRLTDNYQSAAPKINWPCSPRGAVPPEYLLPSTGPNGEPYSYKIVTQGEGENRQAWLERSDGDNPPVYQELPNAGDTNYSLHEDCEGHPYIRYNVGTNLNVPGPFNPTGLPPPTPASNPIS
jgi:hypothetical protein